MIFSLFFFISYYIDILKDLSMNKSCSVQYILFNRASSAFLSVPIEEVGRGQHYTLLCTVTDRKNAETFDTAPNFISNCECNLYIKSSMPLANSQR